MKLTNVEKVENTIYSVNHIFSMKHVINLGIKTKEGIRLDPIYDREYPSTKYTNRPNLEAIQMQSSHFITLSYANFKAKKLEDIYISYPHLPEFISTMEQVLTMVNTQDMYTASGVNPKYAEAQVRQDGLGGGKSIIFVPHLITYEGGSMPGVLLFLNSDEYVVEIPSLHLFTMYSILTTFNLYTNSLILLNTALLYDNTKGGASFSTGGGSQAPSNSSFNGGGGAPQRTVFGNQGGNGSPSGFKRQSSFGGGQQTGGQAPTPPKTTSNFKAPNVTPNVVNTSMEDLDKAINENFPPATNIPDGNEGGVPFDNVPQATTGGNDSVLSLNNVLETAAGIDIPDLSDGGVDFE